MSDCSLAGARNWHNEFPEDLEKFERIREELRSLGITTVVNIDTDPTYPPRSIRVIFPDGEIDFYSRKPKDMIMSCNEVHLVYDEFIERIKGKLKMIFDEQAHAWVPDEMTIKTTDNPVDPSHYKTKSMECRDIIKVMVDGLNPMEAVDMANIIKYLYRFKNKDGMKDLKKVAEYAKFLIEDTDVDKGE